MFEKQQKTPESNYKLLTYHITKTTLSTLPKQ